MSTDEWDELSNYEKLMYLEGLRNEGILVSDEGPEVPPPPRSEAGKPMELGPQRVDLSRVNQRVVSLPGVNWGPPE
ncbi:MAG TPA: hypothetical protein VGR71_05060 [Nitrospira sp.]|nr:hypothetical protein [Nitrospira sp.]